MKTAKLCVENAIASMCMLAPVHNTKSKTARTSQLRDSKTRVGAARHDGKLEHHAEKREKQQNHHVVDDGFVHDQCAIGTVQILYTAGAEAPGFHMYPPASICGLYKECVDASPGDSASG